MNYWQHHKKSTKGYYLKEYGEQNLASHKRILCPYLAGRRPERSVQTLSRGQINITTYVESDRSTT